MPMFKEQVSLRLLDTPKKLGPTGHETIFENSVLAVDDGFGMSISLA